MKHRTWGAIWFFACLLMCGVVHADQVTYVYTDPQGTPLAEADEHGNITKTFDYRPYGEQAAGQPPNGPGYTGHVNDPDTGLVYMQARYYDPATMRFSSVDPVAPMSGDAYGFNRYAYARNNPISNIDPDGREAACVSMAGHCGGAANNLPVAGMAEAARELTEPLGAEFPEYKIAAELLAVKRAAITIRAEQGLAREVKVAEALKAENPGAKIQNQQYLRSEDGKIAKDTVTGEGRRVDHAVIKDGKADTYETTSMTAEKGAQAAKERRILDNGGAYIRDRDNKNLVPVTGSSQIRREK
jgi:RHS repeat-associated protein